MNDQITQCAGLVLQFNPHRISPGALIKADNCVVDRENICEDRRGYLSYLTLSNSINQLLVYQSKILAQNGTAMSYDNSGSPADYAGTYSPPANQKMRSIEAFSNLYVTTSRGIQVFTDTAGTAARLAGSPRSLDPQVSLNSAQAGFMTAGNQVAYRAVIQKNDANGNVINGYPSTRVWIANPIFSATGDTTSASNQLTSVTPAAGITVGQSVVGTGIPLGTTVSSILGSTITLSANATATAAGVAVTFSSAKNVDLTLHLPSEVTTSDVLQFFRTAQVTGTSDIAGDEEALVYQYSPTATDLSNGYVSFTDVITDDLRGAALYTSPSQEGILQASDRPPLANDICVYKSDYVFFANTSTRQRLYFSLVGVTGLTGKTLELAGVTYHFGATEDTATGTVGVSLSAIAAINIDLTARSLVRVINQYAANTSVYAYYLSDPNTLPGQIVIEERGIGGAAFSLQSSDTTIGEMFFPPPPVSPATNAKSTSSNQVQKNALFFSKAKQPECVPGLNNVLVGSANKNILRIKPLRNSLVIVKEEGVFLLTGDQPQNFSVTPLDLTVFCKSADTVDTLANQVFMLSNQGVVAISEVGVRVVSHEIEPALKPLIGFPLISQIATGASYESDRHYFLSVPSILSDSAQNQTYVYNYITKTWTHWTFGFNAAIVEPGVDKLYFAKPSQTVIYRERKDFQDSDYADPESQITITAIDIALGTITFTTNNVTPQIGWVIVQGGSQIPILDPGVGIGIYTALMGAPIPPSLTTGAATLYPSVGMEIEWDAWTGPQGQAAGLLKNTTEVAILADPIPGNNTATYVVPTFRSNFDDNKEEVPIQPPGGGWGGNWGSIPWGGSGGDSYGYRTYVPRNKQRSRILNVGIKHKNALEKLACAGISFDFEVLGERIGR